MISWIVKMLLFWHYQKLYQLNPGVKISYDILTPLRYFQPPQIINDEVFVSISYLLNNIYHYIKIVSMISWIVIMLLFWHYQKLSQLDPEVKISYDILTPQLDILHLMFAFRIYLIRSIIILKSINDFFSNYNAFILILPKTIPPQGKKSYDILTDSPQIINDKVLFVAHICFIRSINILTSWMISCLSSANAFNFCTTKNYPNLTRG